MASLPIWVPGVIMVGAVVGIVLARLRLPWARTRRPGAVAGAVGLAMVILVAAGRGRWPAVELLGFFVLPVAAALTVASFGADRLRSARFPQRIGR